MGFLLRRLRLGELPAADGETAAVLVALARQDRQACAALCDRYFEALYRYCYVRLGSRDRTEDATQQVFMRAMEAVDRYQEAGRFRSWLFTIAHNSAGMWARPSSPGRSPTARTDLPSTDTFHRVGDPPSNQEPRSLRPGLGAGYPLGVVWRRLEQGFLLEVRLPTAGQDRENRSR